MDAFTANVVTIVISSLGLIGNLLCLLVLFQKNMRKFCYTYLLIGLTFSDIFLLTLSIIRTLASIQVNIVDLHDPSIQTVVFFWDWMATAGTKLYTVAISLERCYAICFPLRARDRLTKGFGKKMAFLVFCIDLLIATTSFIYVRYGDSNSFQIYAAIILHFLPFVVVLSLNLFIYLGLRKFQKERKNLNELETSEVSVTRMLFTVVAVFGICYSFEFIRRILAFQNYSYLIINQFANYGYVLNSSVNFLIYYLLGKNFRQQFIKLIKRLFCASQITSTPTSSVSTTSTTSDITNVE